MSAYIYSDRISMENGFTEGTLEVTDGKISRILQGRHPKAEDYSGAIVMPGVIDVHVHINEPGRTEWEGFDTATRAAALGGTTTIVDMPLNSSPVVSTPEAFEEKLAACRGKLHVNCGFWAGGIGQDPAILHQLIDRGCLGIKVFLCDSGISEFPGITLEDLDVLMASLRHRNVPVLAHCELLTPIPGQQLEEFPRQYSAYLASRPASWEVEAIKAFSELSKRHQSKAHIVHLATENVLPLLKEMKRQAPITVETCPHYLFFRAEDIAEGNTLLKCAPPIRKAETQAGLLEGIKSGIIDFLATDHSPAPPSLKSLDSGNFATAWGGIASLQFLLSASWTAMERAMELEAFIPLLTSRPAEFLGLSHRIGKIAPGYDADLCVWMPEERFRLTADMVAHKHDITPYLGHTLSGKLLATFVNGQCVAKDSRIRKIEQGKIILGKKKQDQ